MAVADVEVYFRVRDLLGMPHGGGHSIVEWCTLAVRRHRWQGRKARAAAILLDATRAAWPALYEADAVLRGVDGSRVTSPSPERGSP